MSHSIAAALLGASARAWEQGARTQSVIETLLIAHGGVTHARSVERSARIRTRNARHKGA